jgi:hypothetical protein
VGSGGTTLWGTSGLMEEQVGGAYLGAAESVGLSTRGIDITPDHDAV